MKHEEQIQYLALEVVQRDTDQIRTQFDPESLQRMAESLKEVGLLVPIRVRLVEGRYVIVDGEQRLRAAKLAGFATIAAIVEGKDLCRGEVTQRQLVANCQRTDLNVLEKSNALQGLMRETGWNATTVAGKLGFSNATVSRLLALGELPEAIREQVHAGEIPLSAARELARVDNKETQATLATQVASGLLTRDALAGAVRSRRKAKVRAQAGVSRVCCKLPTGSAVTVAADALDLEGFILALEDVLAKARKARTQGLEVSTLAKMFRDQARA